MSDPTPQQPRLRDRTWSLRGLLGVALATLLIGGLTGAGITALAADGDQGDRWERKHDRWHQRHDGGPMSPWEQRPGPGPKPWKHPHFYWNDGPQPADPGMPSKPRKPKVEIVPPLPTPSPTESPRN